MRQVARNTNRHRGVNQCIADDSEECGRRPSDCSGGIHQPGLDLNSSSDFLEDGSRNLKEVFWRRRLGNLNCCERLGDLGGDVGQGAHHPCASWLIRAGRFAAVDDLFEFLSRPARGDADQEFVLQRISESVLFQDGLDVGGVNA